MRYPDSGLAKSQNKFQRKPWCQKHSSKILISVKKGLSSWKDGAKERSTERKR